MRIVFLLANSRSLARNFLQVNWRCEKIFVFLVPWSAWYPFQFFSKPALDTSSLPDSVVREFCFLIRIFNAVVVHFTSCLCARFELSPDLPFIDLVLSNFCFKVRYVTSLFAICSSAKSPFSETSEMVQRSYMRDHRMSSPLMICLIIKKCLLYW